MLNFLSPSMSARSLVQGRRYIWEELGVYQGCITGELGVYWRCIRDVLGVY